MSDNLLNPFRVGDEVQHITGEDSSYIIKSIDEDGGVVEIHLEAVGILVN
jgi:hypothetical protein